MGATFRWIGVVAMGVAFGCGSSPSGESVGSACDPTTGDSVACASSGNAVVQCSGNLTWQVKQSCGAGATCAISTAGGVRVGECKARPKPVVQDGGSGDGGGDAGVSDSCAVLGCSPNAHCDTTTDTCVCDEGFAGAANACKAVAPVSKQAVCERWTKDRASLVKKGWKSAGSCAPGTLDQAVIESALRLTNLYRWLCKLPAITSDPTFSSNAQQCALMIGVNKQLSHTPPKTWKCYTDVGAGAASSSNLSLGSGAVDAVDGYIRDDGDNNWDTLGHRRWIFSNTIGPTGFGSVDTASCQWVMGKQKLDRKLTMWPPDGYVPLDVIPDDTGWSVQSDTVALPNAGVVVKDQTGAERKVKVRSLGAGFGSKYAIAINPDGWFSTPGETYTVMIPTKPAATTYTVRPVTCSSGPGGTSTQTGCEPATEPGCDGCACEMCVCDADPFCCASAWDASCVGTCTSCGSCK